MICHVADALQFSCAVERQKGPRHYSNSDNLSLKTAAQQLDYTRYHALMIVVDFEKLKACILARV